MRDVISWTAAILFLWTAAVRCDDDRQLLALANTSLKTIELQVSDWVAKNQSGYKKVVMIRVTMRDGEPNQNGCGFYCRVDGHRGSTDYGYFPKKLLLLRGPDFYTMRITSPRGSYEQRLELPQDERIHQIELRVDGWHDTFINTLCVDFGVEATGRVLRTFCVDKGLLKACKSLLGDKWNALGLNRWDDIMMTRTVRGTHKIVFHDVETLVDGFEELVDGRNDEYADYKDYRKNRALHIVCDRIDLVKGTDDENNINCPADLFNHTTTKPVS